MIIKEQGFYNNGNIETEKQLLEAIYLMVSMLFANSQEYYNKTSNKIMVTDDFLRIIKPMIKGDMNTNYFLGNMVNFAKTYFNISSDDVLIKCLSFYNPENEEEVIILNKFSDVSALLEIVDNSTILFPEKWFSPQVYKKVSELLKTFDFERFKQGKRTGYKACGEFGSSQVVNILNELNGMSLSDKFEFYPTPQKLVDIVLEHACIQENDTILEPSCGKGDLIKDINNKGNVVCVEINDLLAGICKNKGFKVYQMPFEDFKNGSEHDLFDKIVMNPPFAKRMDAKHIVKAFEEHLKIGGKLVCIHSTAINTANDKASKQFQKIKEQYGTFQQTYQNEFKKSGKGTSIEVCITVLEKDLFYTA